MFDAVIVDDRHDDVTAARRVTLQWGADLLELLQPAGRGPVADFIAARRIGAFAGGFSAAMAVVTALKKTGGDTGTEKLIAAMEGMSFDTPKGKMTFRKEDHQAMQDMFHFRIKNDPAFAWGVPELVRVIPASELNIPIRNKR